MCLGGISQTTVGEIPLDKGVDDMNNLANQSQSGHERQPPRGQRIRLCQEPAGATSFWHFGFEMRKSD
jgi:hypothetical protein